MTTIIRSPSPHIDLKKEGKNIFFLVMRTVRIYSLNFLKYHPALADVAQWIERWPANHRVVSQGTSLGCGPGPQ